MDFSVYTEFPNMLKDEWNQLLEESVCHVPFLRFEYLNLWWATRGGGEWPDAELFIVTARSEGRLTGIAPLFFTTNKHGQRALMLLGSIEISDYLDLIVRASDLPGFSSELLAFLRSPAAPAWEVLDLYNFIDSSPSLTALTAAAQGIGWDAKIEQLQHSPYISLPGDWETYLAAIDKKQRHEIRRKMRRAEEAEAAVRWFFVDEASQLDQYSHAFLDLMAFDEEKAAFLTPPMRQQMIETMRCAFEAGCLRLAFLEINAQPAAAYFCFDYLNRLWVYNSGINRNFNEYSPGWVLLGYLLQWSNTHQIHEFDFMRGDEEYKYRFGATDRFVMRWSATRS